MSRLKIAAGNWKMNKNHDEALDLLRSLSTLKVEAGSQVILGVPYIYLKDAKHLTSANEQVSIAAQNCHHEQSGAYTGEISVPMLSSIGIPYVIIGHSERRAYNHEDDAILAKKVDAALKGGLRPIFCCGEPLTIRKEGSQNTYVQNQIGASLFHLDSEEMKNIIIAYEPIWAIGTGETASPEQAQDMHAHIRSVIEHQYGHDIADNLSILYGGSVKPSNAEELFAQTDVDGGLVGGASLNASDFSTIATSF